VLSRIELRKAGVKNTGKSYLGKRSRDGFVIRLNVPEEEVDTESPVESQSDPEQSQPDPERENVDEPDVDQE